MSVEKKHFPNCMLFEFNSNENAVEATQTICNVYGEEALDVCTCQRWLARFRDGDADLNDKQCKGRPLLAKNDDLEQLLQEDPRLSIRELAFELNLSVGTIFNRLKARGKVLKVGRSVLMSSCSMKTTSLMLLKSPRKQYKS